jgi:hypothetical protein
MKLFYKSQDYLENNKDLSDEDVEWINQYVEEIDKLSNRINELKDAYADRIQQEEFEEEFKQEKVWTGLGELPNFSKTDNFSLFKNAWEKEGFKVIKEEKEEEKVAELDFNGENQGADVKILIKHFDKLNKDLKNYLEEVRSPKKLQEVLDKQEKDLTLNITKLSAKYDDKISDFNKKKVRNKIKQRRKKGQELININMNEIAEGSEIVGGGLFQPSTRSMYQTNEDLNVMNFNKALSGGSLYETENRTKWNEDDEKNYNDMYDILENIINNYNNNDDKDVAKEIDLLQKYITKNGRLLKSNKKEGIIEDYKDLIDNFNKKDKDLGGDIHKHLENSGFFKNYDYKSNHLRQILVDIDDNYEEGNIEKVKKLLPEYLKLIKEVKNKSLKDGLLKQYNNINKIIESI